MSASVYNEKSKEYRYQYERDKLKRVPLDLQLSDYEELKQAADAAGVSVNGFIKSAIKAAIAAGSVQAAPVGDIQAADFGVAHHCFSLFRLPYFNNVFVSCSIFEEWMNVPIIPMYQSSCPLDSDNTASSLTGGL